MENEKHLSTKKAVLSAKQKSEKVLKKLKVCSFQYNFTIQGIKAYNLTLAILDEKIEKETEKEIFKDKTYKDFEDAIAFYIDVINRIKKILPKFKENTPQYTLAIRRIEAFNHSIFLLNEFSQKNNLF